MLLLLVWLLCACVGSEATSAQSSAVTVQPTIVQPTQTATPSPTTTPTATRQPLRLPTPTPSPILTLERTQLPPFDDPFVFSDTLVITLTTLDEMAHQPDLASSIFISDAKLGATVGLIGDSITITPARTPATARPPLEPTPDEISRDVQIPILMYHYLSQPPPNANIYRLDLSVAPELFEQHLERIQSEGYTTISLYDLLAHLTQGAPLPEKPVILTFDDGYRDNYENGFPILMKYGMKATFFIVTDFIDEARPEYLSWDMVREMFAAGMSIEAHGRNHVSLRGQDDDYLVWQALGAAETIEFELGVRPRFVSYPAGEYDQRTIDIFHSAHYWAGLTTIQGATHSSDNLFELRRVRVRGTTTPDELARLLALNW